MKLSKLNLEDRLDIDLYDVTPNYLEVDQILKEAPNGVLFYC